MFTLNQAQAFVAVAEEKHFGRAAERLHMTQPPLSRRIQQLEKSLGVVLLARQPRGVELTDAGVAFLVECQELLERVERAPRRARLIASGQLGVVRIGYTATSAYNVLGKLLSRIKSAAPKVTVELREMVSAEQLEALHSGNIDVGLARPPFPLQDFKSSLLFTESLMVAVPAGSDLASGRQTLSAKDLRHQNLIMYSSDKAGYFRNLVGSLLDIHPTQVTYTVSQALTMLSLVAAGHGVAVVPESIQYLHIKDVTLIPLEEAPADIVQLHGVWLSDSKNAAMRLVEPLLRQARDI